MYVSNHKLVVGIKLILQNCECNQHAHATYSTMHFVDTQNNAMLRYVIRANVNENVQLYYQLFVYVCSHGHR